MDMEDAEFEAFLRRSLGARADAPPSRDLARRAVQLAARRSPFSFWRVISTLAACVLIGGLLTFAVYRWYQIAVTGDATVDVTDTATVSAADVVSTRNATLLLLGGGVVVAAIGLLTLERLFTRDDGLMPAYL